MKTNWHVLAARCAAAHPHWSWSQVCAHVARRKPARRSKPTVESVVKRMEQMRLF